MIIEHKPIHVLLVEDDDDHADLVLRAMSDDGLGVSVDRVVDGEAALEYLRMQGRFVDVHRPSVVLLDLNLPRLSGQEVLRSIKADAALSSIPVVVLTTSNADRDLRNAYESKVNSYVVKPIGFDEFREMVHHLGTFWFSWNAPPPGS